MTSSKPWPKAPWAPESIISNSNTPIVQRRAPTPWACGTPSNSEMVEQQRLRDAAAQYELKVPWEGGEDDALNNFENMVEKHLVIQTKSPWQETSQDLRNLKQKEQSATNYTYESLWKPVPLSAKKIEQIANYKYANDVPFRREDNQIDMKTKPPRKQRQGKEVVTLPPWAYGNLPADPVSSNVVPQPPTALWSTPPANPVQYQFEPSGDPVLDNFRQQLFLHGASGIAGLGRKFRIMDDDGSGFLEIAEFRKALKECGVEIGDKAINYLFRFFDKDDSGGISFDEFMLGVRGVMNERRKAMVVMAFNLLDKDNSGEIAANDIIGVYKASSHPDVIAGRRTELEILTEFLESFECNSRKKDGIITLNEFMEYYANISASVDSDDYFELMMRNAWHISGGEGVCGNTTNKRVLVTHEDGHQTVEEIKNDLGLKAKDKLGMVARLRAQGVQAAAVDTGAGGGARGPDDRTQSVPSRTSQPPTPPGEFKNQSLQQQQLQTASNQQRNSVSGKQPDSSLPPSSSYSRADPVGNTRLTATAPLGIAAPQSASSLNSTQRKLVPTKNPGNNNNNNHSNNSNMQRINLNNTSANVATNELNKPSNGLNPNQTYPMPTGNARPNLINNSLYAYKDAARDPLRVGEEAMLMSPAGNDNDDTGYDSHYGGPAVPQPAVPTKGPVSLLDRMNNKISSPSQLSSQQQQQQTPPPPRVVLPPSLRMAPSIAVCSNSNSNSVCSNMSMNSARRR